MNPVEFILAMLGPFIRPDWQAQQPLVAAALRLEQDYLLQRDRCHLVLSHGWGVVCGLKVVPVTGSEGWKFIVCPGYGISPCGDELVVDKQLEFDLRDFVWTVPMDVDPQQAWVQLIAGQNPSAYQVAPSSECGCACNGDLQPTRVTDEAKITIAWSRPTAYIAREGLCSGQPLSCPPCPESCALTLGPIPLPVTRG